MSMGGLVRPISARRRGHYHSFGKRAWWGAACRIRYAPVGGPWVVVLADTGLRLHIPRLASGLVGNCMVGHHGAFRAQAKDSRNNEYLANASHTLAPGLSAQ